MGKKILFAFTALVAIFFIGKDLLRLTQTFSYTKKQSCVYEASQELASIAANECNDIQYAKPYCDSRMQGFLNQLNKCSEATLPYPQ